MRKYIDDYVDCLKHTYYVVEPQKIFKYLIEFIFSLMFWSGIDLIFNFIKTYNYRRRNGK